MRQRQHFIHSRPHPGFSVASEHMVLVDNMISDARKLWLVRFA